MRRMATRLEVGALPAHGRSRVRLVGALLAISFVALPASAKMVLSNFPTASDGSRTLGSVDNLAVGFTIGDTAQNFGSAMIRLSTVGITQIDTSAIQASLYGGTPADPAGPVLVTFAPVPGTITQATLDLVLVPTTPFTLDASTTYWLVVEAPSVTKDLAWDFAVDPASGAFATYAGARSGSAVPPTNVLGANLIFVVKQVPEPGTPSLCGVAVGSLLLLRRTRSRS